MRAKRIWFWTAVTLVAVGAVVGSAGPASAESYGTARIQYFGCSGGAATFNVDFLWDNLNWRSMYVYTGQYNFHFYPDHPDSGPLADDLLKDPFGAYCVDLGQTISGAQTYTIRDLEDAPISYWTVAGKKETLRPMGEDKADDLRELFGRYGKSATDNVAKEAFGACIWEIVYENPANKYDITKGALYMTGLGSAQTQAQTWLSVLNDDTNGNDTSKYDWDVLALSNAEQQDFAFTSPGAGGRIIPEPVTMAGLMLGIGSVVTYVRKRRMA